MITKATAGIAAAVCGTLFVSYCIYFDRKRRNDPMFKQKLKERRSKAKEKSRSNKHSTQLPNLRDYEGVRRFFLQEVQIGETLLSHGDIEGGVEHLSNAVAVCGQPNELLQVLNQTLPTEVYQMLLQQIPAVAEKFQAASFAGFASEMNNSGKQGPTITMVEDELE